MDTSDHLIMNWRSALLAVVIICTGLTVALLYLRDVERRSVCWLGALVLSIALTTTPLVIGFAGAYDIWPGLTFLPTQMTLLFGPLIYFHARTLMVEGTLGRLRLLLLPGALYWIYQLWAFTMLGDYQAKWAFNDAFHYPYVLPVVFYGGFGLTLWSLYATWRLRARYMNWLSEHNSNDLAFRPVWLTHFIAIGIPLVLLWALENVLGRYLGWNYFERFWADFSSIFLIFVMSLEALSRIQQPFPKMPAHHETEMIVAQPTKDGERNWSSEGEKLHAAVLENEWYLEPTLSLQELSSRYAMNQSYVSRALNQGLGQSFSQFINSLRVTHAKSMMQNETQSMIDIALASGFGSKASFNRAFKTHTGKTPSQYRATSPD